MKALQDMDSLKEKVKRNIDQVKFAKKATAVQQPCDAGNLRVRERHHSRHVSLSDVPRLDPLNPAAKQIQQWRDLGHLNTDAKTVEHILNMVIRMPTVLQKACDQKSHQQSFFIPGIMDKSQQGPDVDRIMATYKKELPIELKKRLLDEAPLQIKHVRQKGRFLEEEFEEYNYPLDTDSDSVEHPLLESFAKQHHRQRFTIMTNPLVLGDFATAFGATDSSADVQEGLRNERAIEVRWRDDVLTKNAKYEMILAKAAGRSMDDAPEDLASDLQEGRLPHQILAEIANKRESVKSLYWRAS